MKKNENELVVAKVNREVEMQLSDPETMKTLVMTTFKGLQPPVIKQAIVEGMVRGFTFKDFLEKNVYAIPFKDGYSLVTSIDNARKIGMRSGIMGVDAPKFEEDTRGGLISCSITVKRKLPNSETVGDFTATVYFAEYVKANEIWRSKPRTMLAKVAEMHALRKACPEELAQSYVEEEIGKDTAAARPAVNLNEHEAKLKATQSLDELKAVWASLPAEAKVALGDLKDALKKQFEGSA